jgi:DoxX-like family
MNADTQTTPAELFHPQPATPPVSRKQFVTGWILSGLTGAFLLFDGVAKLFKPVAVVKATVELGYPESTIVGIGVVLVISTILYLLPRTAIFGAILLSAYLGGAVATNVRVGAPLFNLVFPVIFGCLVWTGLYFRDGRLKFLLK